VRQAGSYVGPDKLRFDFTYRGKPDREEVARIERMVNDRVVEDAPVTAAVMARDEATALGAIGLFEEKYGERVRVLSTGDYSKELCGGTHVSRTGEIGPFVITTETSTGAATRRVEAVTGMVAVDWYRTRERELEERLAARERRIQELESEVRRAKSGRVGVRIVAHAVDAGDADELLAISDRVRQALGAGAAVVLGAGGGDRVHLVASFGDQAVSRGLSAHEVIRAVAPLVGGGGGGKPGMARAGGKDATRLGEALEAAAGMIRDRVAASE
jgi:alanyl-tRNA synthetase